MRNILFLAFALLLGACKTQKNNITFDHSNLRYEGRVLFKTDAAELSWAGTSVTIEFEGSGVSAIMQDLDTANYYNVIVDHQVVSKFHTDTLKKSYVLASGLSEGKHQVQLFKRTEWDKGKTLFYGFKLPQGGKLLSPAQPKKKKIEFYGNSITSGYGNEDYSGKDRSFGYFQNNYETYAAITARHFDAQYHCISKSGIGIVVSWFPMIMPEMFDLTDATDSTSKWDFSTYTPDVVVINLFQNDSWIVNMPQYKEFKSKFGTQAPDSIAIIDAYTDFVGTIRSTYPNASIICALGSMDATKEGSAWPGYIQKAVDRLNDKEIYTCFFPFKNTGGHPNVEEQRIMADQLIKFIDEHIEW